MTVNELLDSDRARCYWLDHTKPDPQRKNSFAVSLVFENESGHFLMGGRGECASPWYWDEETCEQQNLKKFGVDKQRAWEIVASSMFTTV